MDGCLLASWLSNRLWLPALLILSMRLSSWWFLDLLQKWGGDSLYAIVLGRMLSYSVSKTEGLRQGGSVEPVSRKSSLAENHRPRTNRFEGPQTGCAEDGSGKLNESSSLALHTRLCSRVLWGWWFSGWACKWALPLQLALRPEVRKLMTRPGKARFYGWMTTMTHFVRGKAIFTDRVTESYTASFLIIDSEIVSGDCPQARHSTAIAANENSLVVSITLLFNC